ncbi:MAG TPA: helix-turn-helix domain-containing protein [Bacillus bacterium]|nr:helix-turn-helix domain-containing protein [Bacillus sp. (in: firmicutes)]
MYAEAVGLEPDELFEQYKAEIPATYNEELPEHLSRVQTRRGISPDSSKIFDILPKILIGVFIVGAIAIIWYLIVQSAGNDSKEPADTGEGRTTVEEPEEIADDEGKEDEAGVSDDNAGEEPAEEEAEPEIPAQDLSMVSTSGSNTVYELKNTDKFIVKIVSLGRTWVSVKNGAGKTYFGEELNKDAKVSESADLTNDTQALIKVGFAPDTEIYINDQKLEYAIPPSDAMTQNITINFVK